MRVHNMSLAFRHMLLIVLVSLFFTAATISYMGHKQYRAGVRSRDEALGTIVESYLPPLAAGLFFFDDYQLKLLADGILLLPFVSSVAIIEHRTDGEYTVITSGCTESTDGDSHEYPLVYEYEGQPREIGYLRVKTSLKQLRQALQRQLGVAAVTTLCMIFGFAVVVLIIAQRMIFRHLSLISDYVLRLDPENMHQERLTLPRAHHIFEGSDELDEISGAINTMCENLALRLSEKEALIRELYHRTNNTMQVIQALLMYRSQGHSQPLLPQFVEEINSHIQSISLAHQELYRSEDLSRIDLADYIRSLSRRVLEHYTDNRSDISLSFDLQSVPLLLDSAIPVGIVVNELLINAVKHAFTDKSNGCAEITVSSRMHSSKEIELRIADNGNDWGYDDLEQKHAGGGLSLAYILMEQQLNGTLSIEAHEGTICIIRFRNDLYVERV